MSEIIRSIEKAQLRTDLPEFGIGDTVRVFVKVVEGTRERLQASQPVRDRRPLLRGAVRCGPLGHSRRMDCGALRDLRKDARRPQAISSAEGRPGHEQESPVVPLQFVRQARRAFRRPSDRKPS